MLTTICRYSTRIPTVIPRIHRSQPSRPHIPFKPPVRQLGELAVIGGALTLTAVSGALMCYKVSKPDEYLVRTGFGITDISVTKKGFALPHPLQRHQFVNMMPRNYSFDLHAMSSEKMEFILPVVFTIGPSDTKEDIVKYCRFLADNTKEDMEILIRGIIEGETRVLATQMKIEEIFNSRMKFKEEILVKVQEELNQFGIIIRNANIKELEDTPGSEYFQYMRQKTYQEAQSTARADTAEARRKAAVAEKDKERQTRQSVSDYETQAIQTENQNTRLVAESTAELNIIQAQARQRSGIADIEAKMAVDARNEELWKEVETKRMERETQRLRADDLSKANVEAEKIIKLADADLYKKQKEADGILAGYQAQAKGLQMLVESLGGDTSKFLQYTMIDKQTYEHLAKASADAIQGLEPKITIWNTGNDGDYAKSLSKIAQTIPPMLDTINRQTGIKPADWLVNMSDHKVE